MADINIDSINPNQITAKLPDDRKKVPQAGEASFGQWLNRSLDEVRKLQAQSDISALKLATGENKDIHGTMITMQKADIATSLMIEVRNKLMTAYDEIKRMQF
jgi:flagellar hook-basal body complex protein FliE